MLSERNRKIANIRWTRTFNSDLERIKINSSKYPQLKARLIGYFMSDGCITILKEKNDRVHHSGYFYPDDIEMLESFLEAFLPIYGFMPKVEYPQNYYRIRFDSKAIVNDLLTNGSFRSLEWRMPNFNTDEETLEFIRAFFDAEAYVGPKYIQVQSVNNHGLLQIKEALSKFGISSRIYSYHRKNKNWNINYILTISKTENINNFIRIIGFNHSIKKEKCQRRIIWQCNGLEGNIPS